MKALRIVTTAVFCIALIGAIVTPNAKADTGDKKTVVTFSGPVEIPGVHLKGYSVLPAGTYVFKILDSQANRHIVQIFSEDEKTVYATILAIPNYRLKATDKTVITFRERPAGQPEALRAWFYPGRNSGEEFVYTKAKAVELAKATQQVVLFTPAVIEQEVAEPIQSATEPRVVELKQAPVRAIRPTGEEVELAQVVTPPPGRGGAGIDCAEPSGGSAGHGQSFAAGGSVRTAVFGRSNGSLPRSAFDNRVDAGPMRVWRVIRCAVWARRSTSARPMRLVVQRGDKKRVEV